MFRVSLLTLTGNSVDQRLWKRQFYSLRRLLILNITHKCFHTLGLDTVYQQLSYRSSQYENQPDKSCKVDSMRCCHH